MKKKLILTHSLAFVLGLVVFLVVALALPDEVLEENTSEEEITEDMTMEAARLGSMVYLMDLWRKDYVRINTDAVQDLINDYRVQNDLKSTTTSDGICKVAQVKADFLRKRFNQTYDEKEGMYSNEDTMTLDLESQLSQEEIDSLCPECEGLLYLNSDVTLMPGSCAEENQSIFCTGGERAEINLVENYPTKIMKKWKNDATYNKVLLKPATRSCVVSNGGIVVFAVDSLE